MANEAATTHHAAEAQGLVPEPNTDATFAETRHETVHAEPTALALNGAGWVSLAMLAVIAILIWKKAPAAIGRALDRKIDVLKIRIEEAATLRAEAEALKAEYEKRARDAATEAASIVDHAHAEASLIIANAQEHAETLIARRSQMAEDKIAAAERGAVADLRARAAGAAANAAAQLIAARLDADADKPLIDRTIAGLGARVN
jgi:F-type H+-transporting ATPase subunit b